MDVFHILFLMIGTGLGMTVVWLILTKQEMKEYNKNVQDAKLIKQLLEKIDKQAGRLSELDDLKNKITDADKQNDSRFKTLKSDMESSVAYLSESLKNQLNDVLQKGTDQAALIEKNQAELAALSKELKELKKVVEEKKTEKPANPTYTKCPCAQLSDKPDKADHTACWSPILTGAR